MAVRDVLFIAVLLFAFGVGFFVLHFAMNTVVDELLLEPAINGTQETVDSFNSVKVVVNRLDYLLFMLFIGLVLALIISSWFIAGNIIFMFVYFIVIVLSVIISTVLSNVWETMHVLPQFGVTIASFPLTNNLLTYLPIYISVVGFVGIVTMFAKPLAE